MAEVFYEQTPVRVEIPDTVIGGTLIKRKALLTRMVQTLPDDNTLNRPFLRDQGTSVSLSLTIEHYALGPLDAEGNATYGERLNTKMPGIDYRYEVTADNQSLVDVDNNGAFLCKTSEYDLAKQIADRTGNPIVLPAALLNEDGTEKNWMKEDAFFRQLADNVQLVITAIEKNYIQRAAQANKL